jgi:hypothetical protein
MLYHVAIDLAASGLFGAASIPAGTSVSGPAVDCPRLATPFKRTSHLMPRLAATSLDFVLRLLLYWGAAHVFRKVRAQDHPSRFDTASRRM